MITRKPFNCILQGIAFVLFVALLTACGSQPAWQKLNDQMDELSDKTGIDKKTIISQSFITPSCGTGTISGSQALRVIELTKEVSETIRG